MKKMLFLVLFSCLACFVCLAQEDITITTYYPSPDGVYQTLTTDTLTVNNQVLGNLNIENDLNVGGDLDVVGTADANVIIIANGAFRLETQGVNRLNFRGGDVYFMTDGGSPSTLHVGEVWYCSSYY